MANWSSRNSGTPAPAEACYIFYLEIAIYGPILTATGPKDSWTIHGLWPDHCDGSYDSSCDSRRAYTNLTEILEAAGKTTLLSDMNKYWVDRDGDNESFWEHEWAKHGTCISTLEPECYSSYTPTQEVPDYFQKAVDLFKGVDSYGVCFELNTH